MPRQSTTALDQSRLSESWADVDGNDSPDTEDISDSASNSVQGRSQPGQTPRGNLGASRTGQLRDALAPDTNHDAPSTMRDSPSRRQEQNRMSASHTTSRTSQSARRRHAEEPEIDNDQSFVMPKMEHESPNRMNGPSNVRKTPRTRDMDSPRPDTSYNMARASIKRPKSNRPDTDKSYQSKEEDTNIPALVWTKVLHPSLAYLLSIMQLTANYAKPIFAYAIMVYLLLGAMIMARNLLTTSISSALSPICRIPGSSFFDLPFCQPSNHTASPAPVEFDALVSAQSAFEDILTTSAGGASLPLDMKRSESSIRDLKTVVQYSTLPSRNELVFEFSGFVETARQASSDLTKYNSRIGRAVDRILTTNRWTLQVLDSIAADEASQGRIGRFVSTNLNIFAPFSAQTKMSADLVFEQYVTHTAAIEEQIQALILEAQALLSILQNLDDRLDVIASIAMRDGIKARDDKDELFGLLWTKLGGNAKGVEKLRRQANVLREVGQYRRLAFAHVSGTIVKLQAIGANLEDLRERVARPEIEIGIGGGGVKGGRPLEMHVAEIQMGVERLERVREEGRRIEGEGVQGILGRAEERMKLDAPVG